MSTPLIIALVVIFALALVFNMLISRRNQVNNSFASIDAYLKKRYDLLPNLVSSVQTYMQHERQTLTEITELRSRAMQGTLSEDEKIALNNQLSKALRSISVQVENYPDLKANTNFLQLQAALNELEEQLSASRRAFNSSVNSYNNAVQMFPTNLCAAAMRMKTKQYFEAEETEKQNINVKELFKS